MYGIMTCRHILPDKYLRKDFKFKIKLNNRNDELPINLNSSKFIFSSRFIDITFIQLEDNLNLKKEHFLTPCNDATEEEKIYVIQYPEGGNCMEASGYITSLYDFNYCHNVYTEYGSSGAPLFNKMYEVLGIHRGKTNEGINVATKYSKIEYAIRTFYNNKKSMMIENKYSLERKKLSKEEINELENQGLEKLSNELFKFKKIKGFLEKDLFFYRTNHAWYFTNDLNYNNIKKKEWTIIKSINEDDDNIDYFSISHRHKMVITFLRLNGL
eukprot:jgi/Orpsp1_1/1190942/evm.model.d7180000082325.1